MKRIQTAKRLVKRLDQLEDERNSLDKRIAKTRNQIFNTMKPGDKIESLISNRTFVCFRIKNFEKPTLEYIKTLLGRSWTKVVDINMTRLRNLKGDDFVEENVKYRLLKQIAWR